MTNLLSQSPMTNDLLTTLKEEAVKRFDEKDFSDDDGCPMWDAISTFLSSEIENAVKAVVKEMIEWANKNTVDVKGGKQSAGGNPEEWTFYVKLSDLLPYLITILPTPERKESK